MDERANITSAIGALAVRVDARQWNELESLFTPEVRVDYTSLFGGELQHLKREELIAGWRQLLPGFTRTCHLIGTPLVAMDGSAAHAAASVLATHVIADPALTGKDRWIVGGCYEFEFRKLETDWRIGSLKLARAWQEGNLELPRIARERSAAQPATAAGIAH